MKKILMTFILGLSVLVSNAQIATENAKFLDNTYVTINGGVATPLAFDAVFPVNPTAGIAIGKWLTPEYGVELEGTAWFGSHVYGGTNARTNYNFNGSFNAVRGTYIGVNGLINLANLLNGYNGAPRAFEVNTLVGIGWVHGFRPNFGDRYNNHLGAKTGLDFAFNLGNKKAHTISFRPAVLWNLSQPGTRVGSLAFNKQGAQLYLGLGYTYHFKTSNSTHAFKTYDVGAMIGEIDRLNSELAKKPKEVEIIKQIETVKTVKDIIQKQFVVQFAQNSSVLSDEAKDILDSVKGRVTVIAYASPEGTKEYNQMLSEKRAAVITDYLNRRDVKVISYRGLGCINETSNRIGIIEFVAE